MRKQRFVVARATAVALAELGSTAFSR